MANSQRYWERRTRERFLESGARADIAFAQLDEIYSRALKNIRNDILSIYENYSKKGILDVSELKRAIGQNGAKQFLKKIEKNARRLGLNPDEIYDERYLSRLTRLEALQEQIKLEVMAMAPQEEKATTNAYKDIINEGYKSFQSDFKAMGLSPTFASIDKRVVDVMLKSVWLGENYSNRIWGNTEKFAAKLPSILGSGLLTGQSPEKTARQLRELYDVSRYEALRLVRTEGAYFHNETEAQSYIDDGIERYTLDVTLDSRTSKICLAIDEGKVYYFKDRVVGQNWPPLHTFCRTVPRAILSDLEAEKAKEMTVDDRTKRFTTVKDKDLLKERWKKEMQKQMNPNKSTHDYNAEINNLTQNLKNDVINQEQFNSQLKGLMDRIPEDYPLRGGIEKIAEYNGWEKEEPNANQAKVQKLLERVELGDSGVNLDEKQAKFVVDNEIRISNVRSHTDDIGGAYNQETKILSVDVANLKAMGEDSGTRNYVDKVIKHELGHAIDSSRTKEYSKTSEFQKIIGTGAAYSDEALKISQYRMGESVQDRDFGRSIRNMTPVVYQSMLDSHEALYIGEKTLRLPSSAVLYQLQPDELFAEAYSLFHVNNQWLHGNAPELYDYFTLLLN